MNWSGHRFVRIEVREPTEQEADDHHHAVAAAYATPHRRRSDEVEARFAELVPLRNRRTAFGIRADGSEHAIGGQLRYDSALSLPGGASVPVGALSAVGVDPSARGLGAFEALIADHLHQARERGDAASVLMASQAQLYGRFGYGPATWTATWEADTAGAALRPDAPTTAAPVLERVRGRDLVALLEPRWEQAGRGRAGSLHRDPHWWDRIVGTDGSWMGGGGDLLCAVHPDGYLLYTADIERGRQGLSESEVTIKELVASTVAAECDLWRFATSLPWARTVRWPYAPVDPAPLFWLRDQRQLRRMSQHDFLWLRPLDLAALAAAREFAADGTVALQLAEPVFDDLAGRWDLVVESGAGRFERGTGQADVELGIGDLGALWLGGNAARQWRAAGLIGGNPAGARLLDALLATDSPPRCVARF